MTARLATLLRHDARLQLRNGIYYAYAVVIAFYFAVLIWAAPFLPGWFVGVVIYSDPSVLGFFFLGGLMMLEKAEGARSALAMTPVSAADYLVSKTITLTIVAVIAVAVIGVLVNAGTGLPLLLLGGALTSIAFVGIAAPIALGFKSVTSYIVGSTGLVLPIVLPAGLALLDPMPVWAIIVPTASQLRLILVGLGWGSASLWEIAAMVLVSAAFAAACLWLGIASLKKELGYK